MKGKKPQICCTMKQCSGLWGCAWLSCLELAQKSSTVRTRQQPQRNFGFVAPKTRFVWLSLFSDNCSELRKLAPRIKTYFCPKKEDPGSLPVSHMFFTKEVVFKWLKYSTTEAFSFYSQDKVCSVSSCLQTSICTTNGACTRGKKASHEKPNWQKVGELILGTKDLFFQCALLMGSK